ncbi:MAG: bifunctional adenosylcobinamide kinase/adenosylcobinamide-phosphate guanylyltransferase [Desulfovermiculus sp.]|nr:bifunctional adenosylcobinamide kinase/adenosylcobinamide-phosphate guanylyltransferase [Desulfovermiculus sp.]
MFHLAFILGGCRSGKSRHALELAEQIGMQDKIFLATCQAFDPEMEERIATHQRERGPGWTTVEEPLDIPGVLEEKSCPSSLILLDCLTLWVSNLLMQDRDEAWVYAQLERLERSLQTASGPVLVVSNEVGQGIVPDNPMARRFRDLVGWVNQRVAAKADGVIWMVAGVPMRVKG